MGILLIHGFTATTVEVRQLGDSLHKHGYTVNAPLLPGHGTTIDDLNSTKWQNWTNAAEDAYYLLRRTCPIVFVGGESMGGLITLYLAAQHPELYGILVFAPALKTSGAAMAPFLAPFIKFIPPKKSQAFTPWQGYSVKPLRAVCQLLELQKQVNMHLRDVTQPAIIFQGRNDQTIDPESSQMVLDGISSSEKELIWMENSGHCILLDPEFQSATQKSLTFIECHLDDGHHTSITRRSFHEKLS